MNKCIIHFSIFLLSFCFKCYSANEFRYFLKGKCPPEYNNRYVYLTVENNFNQKLIIKDSAIISKGNFYFNGKMFAPAAYANIYLIDKKKAYYFILDSGTNELTISKRTNGFIKIETGNSISNIEKKRVDLINTECDKIYSQNITYDIKIKKIRDLKLSILKLIENYPEQYYSLIELYKLSYAVNTLKSRELLSTLNKLDISIRDSELGKQLNMQLATSMSLEAGNKLPAFSFLDQYGSTFTNDSLRSKHYLIAFGATWCGPCKRNLTLLSELYNEYSPFNFDIVYINMDNDKKKWEKMMSDYKMTKWINLTDTVKLNESSMATKFNIKAIPFYILINEEGNIVYNSVETNDAEFKLLKPSLDKYVKGSRKN